MEENVNLTNQRSNSKVINKAMELTDSVIDQVGNKVSEIESAISNSFSADGVIGSTVAVAGEKIETSTNYIKEQSNNLEDHIKELIKNNPFVSICAGLGIGILIGNKFLFRR